MDLSCNYTVRGAKLRQLTASDHSAVMALQETILCHLPNPMWYMPAAREETEEALARGEAFGYFAGQALAGFAVCSPWHARGDGAYAVKIGSPAQDTYDIHDMLTHPVYRRRGIQGAFLRLFEEIARALEGCGMYAAVDPSNAPSISGFEKAGYAYKATLPANDGLLRSYYYKAVFPG